MVEPTSDPFEGRGARSARRVRRRERRRGRREVEEGWSEVEGSVSLKSEALDAA